jgi:hypothetical protein
MVIYGDFHGNLLWGFNGMYIINGIYPLVELPAMFNGGCGNFMVITIRIPIL